jgi:hypothetical protein
MWRRLICPARQQYCRRGKSDGYCFLELTELCRESGSQRARSVRFWPFPTMARETSLATASVKGHPAPRAPRFLQANVHPPTLAPETPNCGSAFACIPALTLGSHLARPFGEVRIRHRVAQVESLHFPRRAARRPKCRVFGNSIWIAAPS